MNFARAPAHALGCVVEDDVARGQPVGDGFRPAAPQYGAHAGQQLGQRKRFDDIIVSADREPKHALGFIAAARQYDDRQGARRFPRPQLATDFGSGPV